MYSCSNRQLILLSRAGIVLLAGYLALTQYQERAFSDYPDFKEAATDTNPTVSNGKVSSPYSFLDENKLVYVNIKLN